jgi:hypothetical protein
VVRRPSRVRDSFEQFSLVLVGAALGVLGLLAYQRAGENPLSGAHADAQEPPSAAPGASRVRVARRVLEPGKPSRVVYLNREGAELNAGPDDALFNVSSVVASAGGKSASIPAFAGTASRWSAIAKCIREKFAPFGVRVVERRPVDDDYMMAVLGGTPSDLGFKAKDGHGHAHAIGLAPFNGEPIPNAVVFVFTRTLRESVQDVCEAAGMEIAHAYGLDHARNCRDLMTYMPRCGARRFLDQDIPCGEHKERPCEGGAATQNSYRHLLRVLGVDIAPPRSAGTMPLTDG